MKTIKKALALFTLIFMVTACQKNISNETPANATKLVASKTSLKTGENVSLAVVQNNSQGLLPVAARWSVSPNTGVTMDSVYSFSQNTISFSESGVYTVNADVRRVQCSPEAAAHPGLDTCFNNGTDLTKVSNTITVNN